MKDMIKPIDKELIASELTEDKFARNTSKIGNRIYIVTAEDSPNTMLEIGRLREMTFREAGGGTGKEVDIDDFDRGKHAFKQLIVWDPELKVIVGGYRFCRGDRLPRDAKGKPLSPTSHLFDISDKFISSYLPQSIELGRSFVQPVYQSTGNARKSIYALDNLWDGLGLLVVDHPDIDYFFGKITMYTHYPVKARDAILYFLKHIFKDDEELIRPKEAVMPQYPDSLFAGVFNGSSLEENYKKLISFVRAEGTSIPPLVNAYMKLSPTMKSFGTAINHNFGGVEETGILIRISDIYEAKKKRYISQINRQYTTK